jgi:hypothetical protein
MHRSSPRRLHGPALPEGAVRALALVLTIIVSLLLAAMVALPG